MAKESCMPGNLKLKDTICEEFRDGNEEDDNNNNKRGENVNSYPILFTVILQMSFLRPSKF